jgi:NTE family protein
LRRLNELGVLSRVDTISAVSGGSIIAAHLAQRVKVWPEAGAIIPAWDEVVAAPFRAFARCNLRTPALLRRALPANWLRSGTAVDALASHLERSLSGLALLELPARPRYVVSATDMTFGINWVFERTRMGDFQAGYGAPGAAWTLVRAVAASSCFPPVFGPMRLRLAPGDLRGGGYRRPDRDDLVAGLQLTDGGVYDNMALEPVWKRHRTLLVSDGGALFDYASSSGGARRLLRYSAIVGKQASALRRRWLMAGLSAGPLDGAYWGISTTHQVDAALPTYSNPLIDDVISAIRTDLDAFSDAEIAVLENHGYLAVERAIRRRAAHLIARDTPLAVPWPGWLDDEARIRDALRGSERRTLLGRW